MIYFPLTKAIDSGETAVLAGATFTSEGQAVVRTSGSEYLGSLPSSGTATDLFEGFSVASLHAAPFMDVYATAVEPFTCPSSSPYTITVSNTPVAGQFVVYDQTAGSVVGGATLSGSTFTLAVGQAGHAIVIQYRYAQSAIQQYAQQGNQIPGNYPGLLVNQIGVIRRGVVFTSNYDASVDWTAVTGIKLAASGTVTSQAGTGVAINAAVVQVPGVSPYTASTLNTGLPFLGLRFTSTI